MWWSGRHPGLSDEEDRQLAEEEKRLENLNQDLINEIIDLLGDALPPQIPAISFERVPGDCHGLVKPREIHVREYQKGGQIVPYRGSGKTPLYRITNTEASIVKQTLEFNGLRELTSNGIGLGLSPHDWIVQWSGPNFRDHIYQNLHEYQYVNHFSGSTEMTRKDRIWSHFQGMQRLFGKTQFDFIPETFVIPEQLEAFIQVYEKTSNLWIVKPHASSRGRGIFILQELSEIPLDCLTVISRYIESPYLIQGLKFDLRLYVLVTGFDPLRIYLFKEGLTRFASSVFSTDEEDLGNVYKHLTNYSINKYASNFVENADASHDNVGHKWSLSALNKHLLCCNVDVKLCWSRIVDVIIKTILTVERPVVSKMKSTVSWRSNCFELYGFDLILDENLKPHLLEVNLSPSMQADTPLDYKIKSSLVQETFNLLGPKLADQKQLGETRWKSRAKQLKRQGQRLPYGTPLSGGNNNNNSFHSNSNSYNALKPTTLNTPAARAREAERQQKFHSLQKKALPLASLGEKPLRLLLECLQEFQVCNDFIRIFPTYASVRRYGHMVGIGSTAKSMSATQLLCLALFNEPRFQKNRHVLEKKGKTKKEKPQQPQEQVEDTNTDSDLEQQQLQQQLQQQQIGESPNQNSGIMGNAIINQNIHGNIQGAMGNAINPSLASLGGNSSAASSSGGTTTLINGSSSTNDGSTVGSSGISRYSSSSVVMPGGGINGLGVPKNRSRTQEIRRRSVSRGNLANGTAGGATSDLNINSYWDDNDLEFDEEFDEEGNGKRMERTWSMPTLSDQDKGNLQRFQSDMREYQQNNREKGDPYNRDSDTLSNAGSTVSGTGSSMSGMTSSVTGGGGSVVGSDPSAQNAKSYLNSKSFYWNTSVVSTEISKRGLEALERRINNMTGGAGDTPSDCNTTNISSIMLDTSIILNRSLPPGAIGTGYNNPITGSPSHQITGLLSTNQSSNGLLNTNSAGNSVGLSGSNSTTTTNNYSGSQQQAAGGLGGGLSLGRRGRAMSTGALTKHRTQDEEEGNDYSPNVHFRNKDIQLLQQAAGRKLSFSAYENYYANYTALPASTSSTRANPNALTSADTADRILMTDIIGEEFGKSPRIQRTRLGGAQANLSGGQGPPSSGGADINTGGSPGKTTPVVIKPSALASKAYPTNSFIKEPTTGTPTTITTTGTTSGLGGIGSGIGSSGGTGGNGTPAAGGGSGVIGVNPNSTTGLPINGGGGLGGNGGLVGMGNGGNGIGSLLPNTALNQGLMNSSVINSNASHLGINSSSPSRSSQALQNGGAAVAKTKVRLWQGMDIEL